MDKSLLEILACPSCKGNLNYHKLQKELICLDCRLAYPIRDDIPIMLTEEARKITDADNVKS